MFIINKTIIIIIILSMFVGFSGGVSAGINKDLLDAARDGEVMKVKKMLKKGANINAKSDNGSTPLILATRNGDIETVDLLIKKGADINTYNNLGLTALIIAIQEQNSNIAKLLINKGVKIFYDDVQIDGHILLMMAIEKNQPEVAKLLIKKGVNINETLSGETLLILAARKGFPELAKILIKKGIPINAINYEGYTALDIAQKEGNSNVVKILKNTGVELLYFDNEAQKPYNLALDNIEKGNIQRALHWLDVVINDFPKSTQAKNAKLLKIPISIGYSHGRKMFLMGLTSGTLNNIKKYDGEGYDFKQIKSLEDNIYHRKKLLKELNSFVNDFSINKNYSLGLNSLDLNKIETPKEFILVAKGLANKGDFDLNKLKRDLINNYVKYYLYTFQALGNYHDNNTKARLFYIIANFYKEVILGNEIENEEKAFLNLTNRLINTSIDVADKYSDVKVDAEELKQKIKQMKIKEEK